MEPEPTFQSSSTIGGPVISSCSSAIKSYLPSGQQDDLDQPGNSKESKEEGPPPAKPLLR